MRLQLCYCLVSSVPLRSAGGTVEDTELVEGIVFDTGASHAAGGPSRITGAKIGLIQFCLSPPKTDVCLIGSPLLVSVD